MKISKELQAALITTVSLVKVIISNDLVEDDGSIKIVEQFLFDCEIDDESFEPFPRLSQEICEADEIGDQIHELRRDEKDNL